MQLPKWCFRGFVWIRMASNHSVKKWKLYKRPCLHGTRQNLRRSWGFLTFTAVVFITKPLNPCTAFLTIPLLASGKRSMRRHVFSQNSCCKTDKVLADYDEKKPLAVVYDASPYGLGALLFHFQMMARKSPFPLPPEQWPPLSWIMPRPIRKNLWLFLLSESFTRISQSDTLWFLWTKSLCLDPCKPIPAILSPRMLRWSFIIGAFDYELCYRPGKQKGNADTLIRLHLPASDAFTPLPL